MPWKGVRPAMSTACIAPEVNLYLFPNGEVRVCCMNTQPLGTIGEQSLSDIWNGHARRDVVDRLSRADFSAGCEGCASQIAIEGPEAAYPSFFRTLPWQDAPPEWPIRIEFNLSNACNLQCLQCSGDLSSSIRIHRERRPPLAKVYGEEFFADVRRFIPHLRCAQFAGGEPFMASENFRIWEMVAELNPDLDCVVVTNATQWNRRVRRVVQQLRMSFVFSIDGMSQQTYESIRMGADFTAVLRNVDRFRQAAEDKGTVASINHCLMPQNYRQFGDLLLYAEERAMTVNVSVVRDPPSCSIAALPVDQIRAIHEHLRSIEGSVLPHLTLNAALWHRELDRIAHWATADPGTLTEAVVSWTTTKLTKEGLEDVAPYILSFPQAGAGPTDDAQAVDDLSLSAAGGLVHRITIDSTDLVTEASEAFCEIIGARTDEIVGHHADVLRDRSMAALGEIQDLEVLRADENRLDALAHFPSQTVRLAMVPLRGEDGWAPEARILVAFQPQGSALPQSAG